MSTDILSYRSDPDLLRKLKEAARTPLTSEQRFEQKVSFVYGNLDDKNSMTKDEVRQVVARLEGRELA